MMDLNSKSTGLRVLSLAGSILFSMLVDSCEADTEPAKRRVSKDAMWIAGLCGGVGSLSLAVVALIISTIFIRRYERTRRQEMLSVAPIAINTTLGLEEEDQMKTGASPLSLFTSSAVANQGLMSPSTDDTDTRTAGHVYYNRAMDIDEAPEVDRPMMFALERTNQDIRSSGTRAPEISVC